MKSRNKELDMTIVFIVIYVVGMSLGDNISRTIGVEKLMTAIVSLIITVSLFLYIKRKDLMEKYGLKRVEGKSKDYFYYIPLILLSSVNLWFGVKMNMPLISSMLYALTMILAGIIEEILFRGMLYKEMAESNEKSAMIVSSLLFGVGHIVNLFNGSGAELVSNMCQVVYAISVGFMFVILFKRCKSIIPCIITHSLLNALSTFSNEEMANKFIIPVSLFMVVVSLLYSIYLSKKKTEL